MMQELQTQTMPQSVEAEDDIPDRSEHRRRWKYVVLAAVFVLWVAFLIYCRLA